MKKQYFINGNIIDPHNSINEIGGLIIVSASNYACVGCSLRQSPAFKTAQFTY